MDCDYKKFSDCDDVEEIYAFFEKKKLTHRKYCYYSDVTGIDKILHHQFFWLSKAEAVNDKRESNDPDELFLCLSATDSENIPMWYLYGGIDGRGARISFKNSSMKKWLADSEYGLKVILIKYTNNDYKDIDSIRKLAEDELVSVRCLDVLYLSLYEGEDKCRIKYNNHTNYMFPAADYKSLCNKFKGFHKALPWFYEKEFRIAVKISDSINELIHNNEGYKVAIEFSEKLLSELEIMSGPEQPEDVDFSKYPGFTKYMKGKIKKSRYSDDIKMNLKRKMCESCKKKRFKIKYGIFPRLRSPR